MPWKDALVWTAFWTIKMCHETMTSTFQEMREKPIYMFLCTHFQPEYHKTKFLRNSWIIHEREINNIAT